MAFIYKSKRIDPDDKNWEKKLQQIIENKIKSCMRENGLLDPMVVIIDLPFTKKVMEYLNSGKLKRLPIDSYDDAKDLINHVHAFQSHMHYVGSFDAIMYRAFPTTFHLVVQD